MQIMYMSSSNTKKRFKKKNKYAKSHANYSYKKGKRRFRKNKTENKRRKKHFKNQTMKNKRKKKILFRVKKKIMNEIENNIQKGGVKFNLNTAAAIWTTGQEMKETETSESSETQRSDDVAGKNIKLKTNKGKKEKLKKMLGDLQLIQYHK